MPNFAFTLVVKMPPGTPKRKTYIDALLRTGGEDAKVGIRKRGQIALDFSRKAKTERSAIESAVRNFMDAVAIVRPGNRDMYESYHIDVLINGQRMGGAVVGFKQFSRRKNAPPRRSK